MSRHARTRYVLTVEAMPDSTPAIVRLRRVLKALLRSYRFRAVSVVADGPPETPPTTAPRTNVMISATLDGLANSLDRVAGAVCDLGDAERERVLGRLRRLSADVESLLAHVEAECQVSRYGEPAHSH